MTLGKDTLTGWTMYSLSIDEAVSHGLLGEKKPTASDRPQPAGLSLPAFYGGSFIIPDGIPDLPQDTYIKLPKWRKACNLFRMFSLSFAELWCFTAQLPHLCLNLCFSGPGLG